MKRKLRILMIDKYYFIKGGAERYYFELIKILEAQGHEVIPFSMKHPNNYASDYDSYFLENIEFNHSSHFSKAANALKMTGRIIYSTHAKEQIEKLIKEVKPDLAHLHMIDHQISPSILHVLKKYNVPVLQTVHQYKLVCPNYRFYNPRNNMICEKCLHSHAFHPIIERCHKGSVFAGVVLTLETYIHKFMNIYDNIDIFHVPSDFMKNKLIEGGISENKVSKLYYTINMDEYPFAPDYDDYFVYYGRLAEEKGILTLLQAMQSVPQSKLLVVGEGPQREVLEDFCRINSMSNVEFLGVKYAEELKSIIAKAKFVVVPSEWYDNSPLVIYESFSMGKPVIGSDLGGISELIDHLENGMLFEPKNVNALAKCIQELLQDPKKVETFGKNARRKAELEFSPGSHYEPIIALYQKLLDG